MQWSFVHTNWAFADQSTASGCADAGSLLNEPDLGRVQRLEAGACARYVSTLRGYLPNLIIYICLPPSLTCYSFHAAHRGGVRVRNIASMASVSSASRLGSCWRSTRWPGHQAAASMAWGNLLQALSLILRTTRADTNALALRTLCQGLRWALSWRRFCAASGWLGSRAHPRRAARRWQRRATCARHCSCDGQPAPARRPRLGADQRHPAQKLARGRGQIRVRRWPRHGACARHCGCDSQPEQT